LCQIAAAHASSTNFYGDAEGSDDDPSVVKDARSANATSASVALESTLTTPRSANLRQATMSTAQ
jgi:hypothetical protein